MTINAAVRELRKQLNLSQQAFAVRLGLSISAIQNYEKKRQPDIKATLALASLARDTYQPHLMVVFWNALEDSLGIDNINFAKPGTFASMAASEDRSESFLETVLADALTSACRRPEFEQVRNEVIRVLTPVVEYLTNELNDRQLWDRFKSVVQEIATNERDNNKKATKKRRK